MNGSKGKATPSPFGRQLHPSLHADAGMESEVPVCWTVVSNEREELRPSNLDGMTAHQVSLADIARRTHPGWNHAPSTSARHLLATACPI